MSKSRKDLLMHHNMLTRSRTWCFS